jgi:2-C-methyl-D-erythritol 2,4-cyclodiphosphate synthase
LIRIGVGYDVHCYTEGDHVVLGGVTIAFSRGVLAHSDGDVLLHALCDALLGALALGDIGQHFPNDDSAYKDASSIDLLKHVYQLVRQQGYVLGNIDSVVICEAPKLMPHILAMRNHIATACDADVSKISVKATTSEGIGFIGREEGLAAHVQVLLNKVAED